MGEHKTNPRAQEKAMRVAIQPGQEFYDFQFKTFIEVNRESMDEITRVADSAELRGDDPRRALHDAAMQWNPKDNPERYDYVVLKYAIVARPSALIPDRSRVPAATILLGEVERMPLAELRRRADEAFRVNEEPQRGSLQ